MDTKGRPTKLEDIISAENLLAIFHGPHMEPDRLDKIKHDDKIYSIHLRKAVIDFLDSNLGVQIGIRIQPAHMLAGIVEALLVCIDDAIRQRAECDELREMAGR